VHESADLIGSRLGQYVLLAEIGHGGMGVVFRAEDTALRRIVALKLLAPALLQDTTARSRFQEEIKNAVAIEHPHVVPIYNAGYEEGYFFLAMRLVEGNDLAYIVQEKGPMPERRAMRLVGQIASALHAVHALGIIHRDVKPQNVLVWHGGEPDEHAFLTDFGLARALNDTLGLTRGGILGTPGYLAPELLRGQRLTSAADQYSLACLAHQLLTGHLPFDDDADLQEPRPAGTPVLSARVSATLRRALSDDPAGRFPDIRAFVMSDTAANDAFDESTGITKTMTDAGSDTQRVTGYMQLGLSDERIAEIADLEKSEVIRLRRRLARRAIIGE
jgi:serine/threonine protein kinase